MALQFSLFRSLTSAGVISTLLATFLLAFLSTLLPTFLPTFFSTFVDSSLSFIKAIFSLNRRQPNSPDFLLTIFPFGNQNTPILKGREDITAIGEKICIRFFLGILSLID